MPVEGQQGANIDDLQGDPFALQFQGRFRYLPEDGTIGDDGDIRTLTNDLGHAKRHPQLSQVVRQAFFQAIAIQAFYHNA